jgi:hypothetical protein
MPFANERWAIEQGPVPSHRSARGREAAQHLILAAKVDEFAREENGVPTAEGDPLFDLLA